jgi:hypothetical protein
VGTLGWMLRMRLFLPAGLAALALLAAGCGGGGSSTAGTPTEPKPPSGPTDQAKRAVAAATAKTESSSADVVVHVRFRKSGSRKELMYGATGTLVPHGGTLAIDLRGLGGRLSHELFLRDADGGLVLYTSPSPLKLPSGKTWLRLDLTRYGIQRYGADTTFLAGADQDPLQAAKLLDSPVAKVRYVGLGRLPDQTLDRHYQGTVDVVAAAKAAGVKGAAVNKVRADFGAETKTIDVWVNRDGALARVVVQAPQKAPDGSTLETRETLDFSRYGAKTTLTRPPAAKVEDYFELTAK